jgi:Glucodextranase, domain B
MGLNTITITASQGSNHVTQVVTITRQAASAPTSGTGTGTDTTPPSLTVATPGATSISTTSSTINFSGTATDNVGVASVKWSTNTGSQGTATGTSAWSATIPLLEGSNAVTIRVYDAAGNCGWRSVVVTRN